MCEHRCGECEYLIVCGKCSGYCYHYHMMLPRSMYGDLYEWLRKGWLKRTFKQKTDCLNFYQRKSPLELLRGGTINERWYVATTLDLFPRNKYYQLKKRIDLLLETDRRDFGKELEGDLIS